MSRRPRLSAGKRTKVAIAVAALVGLLGGIAIYRSQLAPPAQPPVADTPGAGETRSPAAAGRAERPPLAGIGSDASVTTTPRRSSESVGVRSREPSTTVESHNRPPRRGPFGIRAIPSGPLAPGLSASLDLVLTNPNAFAITVRGLTVRVKSVSAPRADPGHSCGTRDFTVTQFSGGGLPLRAASTTSLGRMGIARARWPRLAMPDLAVNQDGCKGASLTLDYRGVSR